MNVCFDIGARNIRAAWGEKSGDTLRVHSAITVKTPDGAVMDGRILDLPSVIRAVSDGFGARRPKLRNAAVCVNSTTVISREMILPQGSKQELYQMAKNEILQATSDVSEYVVDFTVQEVLDGAAPGGKSAGGSVRVLATAILQEDVDQYRAFAKGLKTAPKLMDISADLIWDAMLFGGELDISEPCMVAGIGQNNLLIALFHQGKKLFARTARLSAQCLERYYSGEENLVRQMELGALPLDAQMLLSDISENISRVVQFMSGRGLSRPIHSLYLCGGGAGVEGIGEAVAAPLNLRPKLIACPRNIQMPQHAAYHEYVGAVGGLIRL